MCNLHEQHRNAPHTASSSTVPPSAAVTQRQAAQKKYDERIQNAKLMLFTIYVSISAKYAEQAEAARRHEKQQLQQQPRRQQELERQIQCHQVEIGGPLGHGNYQGSRQTLAKSSGYLR